MTNPQDDADLRIAARARLESQAQAWRFLGLWAVLTIFFIAIWFVTNPGGYFWPAWPIIGVGIGVGTRFFTAYSSGSRITQARVDAEVERMRRGPA